MDCYCFSHSLYAQQLHRTFKVNSKQLTQQRIIQPPLYDNLPLFDSIIENSTIYHSNFIERISISEIQENPLWFYKSFISLNRPCIIEGATQGQQIIEEWSNPADFKNKTDQNISISLTPDGFADSIKNQFFVQPYELKGQIKDVIEWPQKQTSKLPKNLIPYIQHQNGNLKTQLPLLCEGINQETLSCLSKKLFNGSQPDAQNFWMGYKNSVSAIHKDPYENFYTVIVGEKHFTLLPPISILYLEEGSYTTGKWEMIDDSLQVIAKDPSQKTRWISTNPDLQRDHQKNQMLKKLQDFQIHVKVMKGEMLYLPSLWYHQVAQSHPHDPYVVAINYWFDMDFSQNHTLYEACRKMKGYN